MLFLDYDGTLVTYADRPEAATPPPELPPLLEKLAADRRNEVVIVSGRDRETLGNWLGDCPVTIVAEHGAWIKPRGESWQLAQPLVDDWKDQIRPMLERYTHRLPGSFVEEKSFSLAWHYRGADGELGPVRAKELLDLLMGITGNLEVQVLQGKKVIEVRPSSVSKGMVARTWALDEHAGFILGFGDDWTDEDLFAALPATAYTIKVGPGLSAARFHVAGQPAVVDLLGELARRSAALPTVPAAPPELPAPQPPEYPAPDAGKA